jgi:D-alanine-D-alanine ligase
VLTVGVLYGGRSGEHDVSLRSAASIVSAIDPQKFNVVAIGVDRNGRWHVQDRPRITCDQDRNRVLALETQGSWYVNHFEEDNKLVLRDLQKGTRVSVDVVFPALHGTYGEDGTLQGLLELSMVPYVGADSIGSSIGIDKDISKRLLRDGGIPVVPWLTVLKGEWTGGQDRIQEAVKMNLGPPPLFVKPARTGSSVGVRMVKHYEELAESIDFALQYDSKVLIEKGITAREIECSVLGNNAPRASVLGEIIPRHEFYSYESKYLDPEGAELVIPAAIDQAASDAIRTAALAAYRMLCCSGMARVDFFVDKRGGGFYLNEINTIPGFTSISMYPKLWEHSGISYPSLIEMLIDLAIERHREKMGIRTDR